ncbi:hypothetical protein ATANTOWER_018837 [Ataeniobius toweri]|uniref:Uncharacterized protein n=1 Tax=Ataeniobius toweri TaxID=208326 RepID=A0ABU7B7D8_9TELE|nr:hypothetical protein [Ataeniobius toweri]
MFVVTFILTCLNGVLTKIQSGRRTSTTGFVLRLHHASPLQPISVKSAFLLSQSLFKASLLRTSNHESPCFPAELRPSSTTSPPSGFLAPSHSLYSSSLHSITSILSGGEDISNPNPKLFIQAHVICSTHVFLRGPIVKEINICYLTSLMGIFVFLL